jgi:hypothetical protein
MTVETRPWHKSESADSSPGIHPALFAEVLVYLCLLKVVPNVGTAQVTRRRRQLYWHGVRTVSCFGMVIQQVSHAWQGQVTPRAGMQV